MRGLRRHGPGGVDVSADPPAGITRQQLSNDCEDLAAFVGEIRRHLCDALAWNEGVNKDFAPGERRRQARKKLVRALDLLECLHGNVDALRKDHASST